MAYFPLSVTGVQALKQEPLWGLSKKTSDSVWKTRGRGAESGYIPGQDPTQNGIRAPCSNIKNLGWGPQALNEVQEPPCVDAVSLPGWPTWEQALISDPAPQTPGKVNPVWSILSLSCKVV